MSLKIKLKQFALTAQFGKIQIGTTKNEIVYCLGKPTFIQKGDDFTILCYGGYEFHIDTRSQELILIQNDNLLAQYVNHDEGLCFENNHFQVDTWFIKVDHRYTFTEVQTILKQENVTLEEKHEYHYKKLVFESGVYFDFTDHSADKEPLLQGIRCSILSF